ncbi:related to ACC deaminase [Phialocephala subalpina]|uniref:Related to ACC deaminase n=1 Tax=Phialocephala subalpina TaxID=576137 RepID=A0A1L7WQX3_9HELO|nr:related to ACC deaminase [Phialocephala subalpina]
MILCTEVAFKSAGTLGRRSDPYREYSACEPRDQRLTGYFSGSSAIFPSLLKQTSVHESHSFKDPPSSGQPSHLLHAGASDHPLGGLGFARWAFEVVKQEKELGVFFDTIIVCAVTGSTFAGMIAGFKYIELKMNSAKRRVIGIDTSAKVQETREQVLRIAKFTSVKIGLEDRDITEGDMELDERYHDGYYGILGERTKEAMRFGAETEGFITDSVYEGKSLAGLMDLARSGEIREGSQVLYAHLEGQLALNAYSGLFE